MDTQEGHIEVVRALIDAKAALDLADNDGWTALLKAANNGHIEIVRALLQADADVNHIANDGATALSLAEEYEYTEIVALLNERIALGS